MQISNAATAREFVQSWLVGVPGGPAFSAKRTHFQFGMAVEGLTSARAHNEYRGHKESAKDLSDAIEVIVLAMMSL